MTPVLAIAYASPRIPLPMIAFPRLKTDIPKEVFPSNYKNKTKERTFNPLLMLAGFRYN